MIVKLVAFSLFTQAAIGTMVLAVIADHGKQESNFKAAMMASAVLSIIGFLAFLSYLGTPAFIFNALSQIGHSWLSREVLFSALFIGLAIVNGVAIWVNPAIKRFSRLAGVAGILNIFIMVNVCRNTSVPAWQSLMVYLDFFAATIILGIIVLAALEGKKPGPGQNGVYGVIGLAGVGIQAVTLYFYSMNFAFENNMLFLSKFILLIAGGVFLFVPLMRNRANSTTIGIIAKYLGIAALTGALVVSRSLFYALSMLEKGLG